MMETLSITMATKENTTPSSALSKNILSVHPQWFDIGVDKLVY